MLWRFDNMVENGVSTGEIEFRIGVPMVTLRKWKRHEDEYFTVPGPWMYPFQGRMWTDMPGGDVFSKRCNFALFRRGLIRLDAANDIVPRGMKTAPRHRGRPANKKLDKIARELEDPGSADLDCLKEVSDRVPDEPVVLAKIIPWGEA